MAWRHGHGRLRRLFTGTTGERIASLAGTIDVHLVTHEQSAGVGRPRWYASPLSKRRQVTGLVLSVLLPVLLIWSASGCNKKTDGTGQAQDGGPGGTQSNEPKKPLPETKGVAVLKGKGNLELFSVQSLRP